MVLTRGLVKISSFKAVRILNNNNFHKKRKIIIIKEVTKLLVTNLAIALKKAIKLKKSHLLKIQIGTLYNKNKCNKRIASKMIIIIRRNNPARNHTNHQINRNHQKNSS